jgi:hypothetical protein
MRPRLGDALILSLLNRFSLHYLLDLSYTSLNTAQLICRHPRGDVSFIAEPCS